MSAADRLYTPELLALTVRLATYPWSEDFTHIGQARSKSCGSTLTLGLDLDPDGRIARIGIRARACAVGQASAAIFADEAVGLELAAIAGAEAQIVSWLAGEGAEPDWPGIGAIAAARSFPARHGAMMLPWQAALAALSSAPASG